MRTIHVSLSVRGALKWDKRQLKRMAPAVTMGGAHVCRTAEDVRDWLLDRLAEGYEVLPMADCEGFDPKTGCPGHVKPEATP